MAAKAERIKAGEVFGRWTVITDAYRVGNYWYVDALCSCGSSKTVLQGNLRKGVTKSCGCLNIEAAKARGTHKQSKTSIYRIWRGIKTRCLNTKHKQYVDYGGRGILICDKWQTFEGFYEDMGSPPFEESSLDREDNNGNYCKENCRWSTPVEQANNRRNSIRYEFRGQQMSLTEIAKLVNIRRGTIYGRLYKYGMTIEQAVTVPVMTASEVAACIHHPMFTKANKRQDGHKLYGETT